MHQPSSSGDREELAAQEGNEPRKWLVSGSFQNSHSLSTGKKRGSSERRAAAGRCLVKWERGNCLFTGPPSILEGFVSKSGPPLPTGCFFFHCDMPKKTGPQRSEPTTQAQVVSPTKNFPELAKPEICQPSQAWLRPQVCRWTHVGMSFRASF